MPKQGPTVLHQTVPYKHGRSSFFYIKNNFIINSKRLLEEIQSAELHGEVLLLESTEHELH